MKERIVDQETTLIPYYPNPEVALAWYQDLDVCKQVDNIDHAYDLDLLNSMYTYLSTHGDCYYIQYRGALVGDVSLRDNAEISIVVCKEYQNLHRISTPSIRRAKRRLKQLDFIEYRTSGIPIRLMRNNRYPCARMIL